jgi:hypothetical protein
MRAAAAPTNAVDAASAAGLTDLSSSWEASVADYDGDGREDFLDIRDGSRAVTHRLLHNDGETFSEVEPGTFRGANLHSCPWADVDQDGLLDMFCTNGADVGQSTKANELWIQNPDHTFTNRAAQYGLLDDVYGRGRDATFIDFNHDAFPDLFSGNRYPRQDEHQSINRFYINDGGVTFRPAPEAEADGENGAQCARRGDWNDDGWEDLLVCGQKRLLLYRNIEGQRFEEIGQAAGLGTAVWEQARFLDWNKDGRLDIARVRKAKVQILLNQGDSFSVFFDKPLQWGDALAFGDVNRDRLTDIYVVEACAAGGGDNLPDTLLVNQGAGEQPIEVTDLPTTTGGCGDWASGIDYDGNGTRDFIVLNGRLGTVGPIQLISFP